LKSNTFGHFSQLYDEFQHYNLVILLAVNLTSWGLRSEQSEFIICFQYTNISVHKLSDWIFRQQETNISAWSRIA